MTELASDWQVSKKCMKERIAVMFNNELMADVHFMVGSESTQRRIPAHKFILATGSPVFYAMFYGSLTGDKEVTIPDVEPEAFLKLLQWVYGKMNSLSKSRWEIARTARCESNLWWWHRTNLPILIYVYFAITLHNSISIISY